MKVRIRLMAQHPGGDRRIQWPSGASESGQVPRIDEVITTRDGETWTVTAVDWYPQGDADTDEPYVYVVAR